MPKSKTDKRGWVVSGGELRVSVALVVISLCVSLGCAMETQPVSVEDDLSASNRSCSRDDVWEKLREDMESPEHAQVIRRALRSDADSNDPFAVSLLVQIGLDGVERHSLQVLAPGYEPDDFEITFRPLGCQEYEDLYDADWELDSVNEPIGELVADKEVFFSRQKTFDDGQPYWLKVSTKKGVNETLEAVVVAPMPTTIDASPVSSVKPSHVRVDGDNLLQVSWNPAEQLHVRSQVLAAPPLGDPSPFDAIRGEIVGSSNDSGLAEVDLGSLRVQRGVYSPAGPIELQLHRQAVWHAIEKEADQPSVVLASGERSYGFVSRVTTVDRRIVQLWFD